MAGALEPNQLLAQQQALRAVGLERVKKNKPDKKHDRKFVFIAIGTILLICGGICAVPFLGDALEWLLNLL